MQDHELKQKLKNMEAPAPSEGAENRAMDAAMQAFAQHQEKKRQGFTEEHRLTYTTASVWEQLIGRLNMKKAYVFVGFMTAIGLVLAVASTDYPGITEYKATKSRAMTEGTHIADVIDEYNKRAAVSSVAPPAASPPPVALAMTQAAAPPPAPPQPMAQDELSRNQGGALTLAQNDAAKNVMRQEEKKATAASAFRSDTTVDYNITDKRMRMATKAEGMARFMPGIVYPAPMLQFQAADNDKFEHFTPNPVKLVKEEPVSTFSIDVNTSSYSYVRRILTGGGVPQKDAVRVEEMVNYFSYNYPLPESREQPFKPAITVMPTPWNPDTKLVHIGIKGYDVADAEKPRANLVFLIDVSGSMRTPDRLPLIKQALHMLVNELRPEDTVGIVVYASQVGVVLEPTAASQKEQIFSAIDQLQAAGGTNGGDGLQQAYAMAESHFDKHAVNRIILSTDGDFNVGITDPQALQNFIEQKRDTGITLSVMGVGQSNYNDAMMQRLAQYGHGKATYVDNLVEAHKALVEETNATLFTIAKDVKLQVEFNPAVISEYRLIGYESRMLSREDFNNDKVDAGDVGAGHAVTAIYEITPVSSKTKQVDDLRYQKAEPETGEKPKDKTASNEYAFLKIRYKLPGEEKSRLISTPITPALEVKDIAKASDDARFAAAVAGFGQLLKGDAHLDHYSYDDVLALAEPARGRDMFGYRAEFLNLVRLAKTEQGARPVPMPAGVE